MFIGSTEFGPWTSVIPFSPQTRRSNLTPLNKSCIGRLYHEVLCVIGSFPSSRPRRGEMAELKCF